MPFILRRLVFYLVAAWVTLLAKHDPDRAMTSPIATPPAVPHLLIFKDL